jgi:hypothetical protein
MAGCDCPSSDGRPDECEPWGAAVQERALDPYGIARASV